MTPRYGAAFEQRIADAVEEERRRLVRDDLSHRFARHQPTSRARRDDHKRVHQAFEYAAFELATFLPEGRELSLAMTKLEEGMFWANAALARSPDTPDDGPQGGPLSDMVIRP